MSDPDLPGPENSAMAAVYRAAREHGAAFDLSTHAKWQLCGADRVRFLNGQVTNDVRRLPPDAALTACVTTIKGKLSGLVSISAWPDFLRMNAAPELREALTPRLERYIIADDVTLRDVTDEEFLLHLLPSRGQTPSLAALPPGCEPRKALRFGFPGVDISGPRDGRAAVLAALPPAWVPVSPALEEVFRIEAGAPRWGAELDEDTLPPEAGLDRTAIDYHKGCYIGQEVISRIKSVGHVNRQLLGFASGSPLAPGQDIYPMGGGAEKPVGRICSATWSFGLESWAALGYLKRAVPPGPLCVRPPGGAALEITARELPLLSP